jgi:hypothetical protein
LGSVWAEQKNHNPNIGNLGQSFRELVAEHPTFETPFQLLLGRDYQDAVECSIVLLRRARSINYFLAAQSFYFWGDKVKLDLAQAFWIDKK